MNDDDDRRMAILEGVLQRWDRCVAEAGALLVHALTMRNRARHDLEAYEEKCDA